EDRDRRGRGLSGGALDGAARAIQSDRRIRIVSPARHVEAVADSVVRREDPGRSWRRGGRSRRRRIRGPGVVRARSLRRGAPAVILAGSALALNPKIARAAAARVRLNEDALRKAVGELPQLGEPSEWDGRLGDDLCVHVIARGHSVYVAAPKALAETLS